MLGRNISVLRDTIQLTGHVRRLQSFVVPGIIQHFLIRFFVHCLFFSAISDRSNDLFLTCRPFLFDEGCLSR